MRWNSIEVLGYDVGAELTFQGATDDQVSYSGGEDPRKYLVVGQRYKVSKIEIEDWRSRLSFEGFEGLKFNSVCFDEE